MRMCARGFTGCVPRATPGENCAEKNKSLRRQPQETAARYLCDFSHQLLHSLMLTAPHLNAAAHDGKAENSKALEPAAAHAQTQSAAAVQAQAREAYGKVANRSTRYEIENRLLSQTRKHPVSWSVLSLFI